MKRTVRVILIAFLIFMFGERIIPSAEARVKIKDVSSGRKEEIRKIEALDWGRDPFMFDEMEIEVGLVLNGIVWDAKSPFAIINDTIVRIGDKVDNSKVKDIQREKVILIKGAHICELELSGEL